MSTPLMQLQDWFGLGAIVLAVALTIIASSYGTRRAGRQKIAESRLIWNKEFRDLSIQLYELLKEIERLDSANKNPIKKRRILTEAQTISVKLLVMINPDSGTAGSKEEYELETYIANEMAKYGTYIDLSEIRKFRSVLKASWQVAKSEF